MGAGRKLTPHVTVVGSGSSAEKVPRSSPGITSLPPAIVLSALSSVRYCCVSGET